MSRPFVSYDGPDQKGFRAEVWVEKGVGVITSIEEKTHTAVVKIKTPRLQHPNIGNIRMDDPLYQEVLKYKDSGQEVHWRIESQRKSSVDRRTPIKELRETLEVAKANTVKILAAINDTFSQEAITNPAEDPETGERISALNTPVTPEAPPTSVVSTKVSPDSLLDQLASLIERGGSNYLISAVVNQLILSGVDMIKVDEVLTKTKYQQNRDTSTITSNFRSQSNFAKEEARWKEFNSDNYVNIGSSIMQAVIGAEGATKDELFRSGVLSEEELNSDDPKVQSIIRYSISLILELADFAQARLYELQDSSGAARFRPDRALDSHTRARGLVYDTIKKYLPLPGERDNDIWLAWRDEAKAVLENRVRTILSVAYPGMKLAPAATPESSTPERPSEEASTPAATPESSTPERPSEEAPAPIPVNVEEFLPPRSQNVIDGDNPPASEDGVELLKTLVASAELNSQEDILGVGLLLKYLFGVSIAKELSESNLNDFIDFYAVDEQLLVRAVNWIKSTPGALESSGA